MIDSLKQYSAMKNSGVPWLGQVPGHWDVLPLAGLARLKSVVNQSERQLLSVYLQRGVVRFADVAEKRTNATSGDLSKYQAVDPGDFVLNNQQAWRGSVGVSHYSGIVSPAYLVLALSERYSAPYANLLFRDQSMVSQYLVCSKGVGTIQRNLYWPHLKRVGVVVPPPDEQAAIVRFLDWTNGRLERAIRAKRKVVALLGEQKQAIIHRVVTRGLDPDVPLKPSGMPWLGDIPQHWEVIPLKFLCRRIQNGATPSTSERRYYSNGTVPWFGPSSISTSSELGTPVRHLASAAFDDGKARLIGGPAILVIVIGATAGKMSLLLGEGATNQQITAFELKQGGIAPQFGIHQLRCSEAWLKSTASTATIPILDSGIVNRLPLALPPVSEQERVLSALSKETLHLTTAISRLEREIELLREYRTRLVADVVTGKLDVREAAARLPDEAAHDLAEDDAGIAEALNNEAEDAAA